jgi:hypothetical protein
MNYPKTIGSSYVLQEDLANEFISNHPQLSGVHILPYLNGKDFTSISRGVFVIDFYGIPLDEVRSKYPSVYNYLLHTAKPERAVNRNKKFAEDWWVIGHPRQIFRSYSKDLSRFIITPETAKHRFFSMLDKTTAPDSTLVTFGFEDYYSLGVLSSRIHVSLALKSGGRLGVGNDPRYNKTRCFDTFPFPETTESQKQKIRNLAERLDGHRKRQQSLHPKLTLTGIYNVLEKERAGDILTDKERKIYQDGLIGVLHELHDELNAAVAEAYGWPADLPEADILQRLVDLNAERAAEEARGLVRWLRPEYQAPNEAPAAVQSKLDLGEVAPVVITEKRKWNAKLPLSDKTILLRDLLVSADGPLSLPVIAEAFKPKLRKAQLAEVTGILGVLEALGQADGGGGVWRGV